MIYRTAAEREVVKKTNEKLAAAIRALVGAGAIFLGTVGIYFLGLMVGDWLLKLEMSTSRNINEVGHVLIPWIFGLAILISPIILYGVWKICHGIGEDILGKTK